MDCTAIILSGGFSKRFGFDKGILRIGNKSLIAHVAKTVSEIVSEIIVVTNTKKKIETYSKEIHKLKINFFLDIYNGVGPLAGALTGLKEAKGKYSLIVPFDTPFLSKNILSLLFKMCKNKSAVVPRWSNGYIEPLHAVYNTKETFNAAKKAIADNETKVRSMIQRLENVYYIPIEILRKYDPQLLTFLNINRPSDLLIAKKLIDQNIGSFDQ